jgi:hypothetical protein
MPHILAALGTDKLDRAPEPNGEQWRDCGQNFLREWNFQNQGLSVSALDILERREIFQGHPITSY